MGKLTLPSVWLCHIYIVCAHTLGTVFPMCLIIIQNTEMAPKSNLQNKLYPYAGVGRIRAGRRQGLWNGGGVKPRKASWRKWHLKDSLQEELKEPGEQERGARPWLGIPSQSPLCGGLSQGLKPQNLSITVWHAVVPFCRQGLSGRVRQKV